MAGPSDGSDYSLWLHLTALLVLMEEEKRSQTESCASARALSTVAQLFQSTPFIATAIRLTFRARRCAQCTGKLPLPVLTCGQTSELKPRPTPPQHARARAAHARTHMQRGTFGHIKISNNKKFPNPNASGNRSQSLHTDLRGNFFNQRGTKREISLSPPASKTKS